MSERANIVVRLSARRRASHVAVTKGCRVWHDVKKRNALSQYYVRGVRYRIF